LAALTASRTGPARRLDALKARLEGRWVKLSPRKRGIVMLVEHSSTDLYALGLKTAKSQKARKTKRSVAAKHGTKEVAWVIVDLSKTWMMEPDSKIDFDFLVEYDPASFADEDVLELYKLVDEQEEEVCFTFQFDDFQR
jgi:hypothetical protein